MIVEFVTRPGWDGWGDTICDGDDLGWSTMAEALELAKTLHVTLTVTMEEAYETKNPRREG